MGPPGWARGSSLMTPSSVLEELMGRTPARETVAALWSVPASTTPTPTSRPASWPGALAVARTTPLESTPLFLRSLLDRLCHVLPAGKPHWLLLQLLGLLRPAVPDMDGQREKPSEPGCRRYAERWISHREEEGCCSGRWSKGTEGPQPVQPVQRLLGTH